jgi:hypothetical protein
MANKKAGAVGSKMRIRAILDANKIVLTILTSKDAELASIEFPIADAGQYAAVLLRSAQMAFEESGRPPPDIGNKMEMPVILFPNSVRSAQIPKTDATALIYHFGEALIGISIPKEFLPSLGRELFAASAPTDSKPQ